VNLERQLLQFSRARPGHTPSARLRKLVRCCITAGDFTPAARALASLLVSLAPDRQTLRWNLEVARWFRAEAERWTGAVCATYLKDAFLEAHREWAAPQKVAAPHPDQFAADPLDEWLLWTTFGPRHRRFSYSLLRDSLPDPNARSPGELLRACGYVDLHALDLWVDEESRTRLARGRPVPLQPREVDVLLYLVRHADRAVPIEVIVRRLWGGYTGPEACYKTLSQLRKKLAAADLPDLIRSEPWVGRNRAYQLDGSYRVAILMCRARYRYAQLPARVSAG